VLARVVVLFSAFSPSIVAGQSLLRGTNDVTLLSAIKFAAEDHSSLRCRHSTANASQVRI
jgi:hypothetical protein